METQNTVTKILIVEDDLKIAKALKSGLEVEKYAVTIANSGEEAFFLLNSEDFDLTLLDWMLPGKSGPEILRVLRAKKNFIPTIIITAKDAVENRVEGLDSGADDYLVKPFAFPELLARVRALLRRGAQDSKTNFHIGDLQVDLVHRKVQRSNAVLDLTVKEFDLIVYLLKNAGHIVSREMLAKDVWNETQRATSIDNVIDVHMARLRKKIDQDFPKKLIHTIRGVGFKISESE